MLHRHATLLCTALLATDAMAESQGVIEGSQLELRNRNFYFNRDLRNHASNGQGNNAARPAQARKGYREEWAHGVMLGLTSGFTQGIFGLGVDAHTQLGLKLDSGPGRTGTLLLPVSHDRQRNAEVSDHYTHTGAALKARALGSELKWGEMRTSTPVFTTADSRLLPEMASGFYLRNAAVPDLLLEAGHFTAYRDFTSSNADDSLRTRYSDIEVRSLDFAGATYQVNDTLGVKLFHARAKDNWLQNYLNINQDVAFSTGSGLNLDLQLYRTDDTGRALSGAVANTSWSLAGAWRQGAHRITLAYQQIDGDTPFDYVGGLSIDLANSVQISDFNAPGMKSRQVRYDLDLAGYGIPGLNFMTRYITGSEANDQHWRAGQHYAGGALSSYGAYDGAKWHELNLELRYVVQQGPIRDLSIRTRMANYRGNQQAQVDLPDINEVRVIVEYPLKF